MIGSKAFTLKLNDVVLMCMTAPNCQWEKGLANSNRKGLHLKEEL